jgi:hypothetical protein
MKRLALSIAVASALTACASPGVSAKVDAAVVGLTTAESLALIYTKLPRCTTPSAPSLCSDQATVDKIKSLDTTAYNAVKAAEANEALLGVALSAVTAFQSAIPKAVN